MRPSARTMSVIATALLVLWIAPGAAWAHGELEQEAEGHEDEEATEAGHEDEEAIEAGHEEEEAEREPEVPRIELEVPDDAELGSHVTLRATLTDPHDGRPIEGASVLFRVPAVWGEEIRGWMTLGSATTDELGTATLTTQVRSPEELMVEAVFSGGGGFAPASGSAEIEVVGDAQLVEPSVGIRIPWLNLWLLAGVIALVWGLYLLVGRRVLAIARAGDAVTSEAMAASTPSISRRSFLARFAPLGVQAGIAAFGSGLVALVARSPRTHGNLLTPPATDAYRRTQVARVGDRMEMRPMPAPLDRPVSFSRDVLPIFLAHGGPHAVPPEHSPPPGGLRLDSYEGVMAKEGVVVPGEPEESELVEHLLSVGMQMPPSVPPLPEEQIQLIVTWIAQGARDD